MQQLLSWTLEAIRKEDCFSWMEERRYDWAPIVRNAVLQLSAGKTMLVLTDKPRRWFGKYIVETINAPDKNRPLLPVFPLAKIFPHIDHMTHTQELELIEDMLDIAFSESYFIWYIGVSDHNAMKLAYRRTDSFVWVLDEAVEDSFYLRGSDPSLDIKLLQLYKLFDNTLHEALFGDLNLE